jgi:molybdopterin molybdotransferase
MHDSDVSSAHDEMVWRETAIERARELRERFLEGRPTTTVSVDELSGHTLAEPVVADGDQPAHSHATMDGFAIRAADEGPLELVDGEIYPESSPPSLGAGEAVRIATGAPLPEGADAVLKREDATVDDGRLLAPGLEASTYVYERGSNVSAGEVLYGAGRRLVATDAVLLRDVGRETVPVVEPFSVGLLATGSEIHEGRHDDLDSPMLANLVRSWGHEPSYEGTVPDEGDRVRRRIAALAAEHDVVVTTGGTSVGRKDHVIDALDSLGDVAFHRVRIRPGKPIAVAALADRDALAVAIPGKPIGAYVIATFVARAVFIGEAALPTVEATVARDVGLGPDGFEYVIPVVLEDGEAMPLGHVDSPLSVYERTFDPSVLSSSTRAAAADGFVVTTDPLTAGETVDVVPTAVLE